MHKNTILALFLILFSFIYLHNAYFYPVAGGFDGPLHFAYTEIISSKFRIPTYEETREFYNPPIFYLTSGLLARFLEFFTKIEFKIVLKSWQYINVFFTLATAVIWYKILLSLYPKKLTVALAFLILFLSAPVVAKTTAMYNPETLFMFLSSLTWWFLIKKYFKNPSIKNILILSILTIFALLTRIPGMIILASVIVVNLLMFLSKKISSRLLIRNSALFLIIIFLATSWYYIGGIEKGVYKFGEYKADVEINQVSFFLRQPISFYIDVPFVLLMTSPYRGGFSTLPNRLIPIYYSEFWGDYWNYYRHQRYPLSEEEEKKFESNKFKISQKRLNLLAWQNRINLPLTLLMIIGTAFIGIKNIIFFMRKKADKRILVENGLFIFNLLTWLAFMYALIKFPQHWKGDNIKPTYMLFNIPVMYYFLTIFLFVNLRKNKILFTLFIISIIAATLSNLFFIYY